MKTPLFAATLVLLAASTASAQFVHGKPGNFFSVPAELRFTQSSTLTATTLGFGTPQIGFNSAAADQAGGRLFALIAGAGQTLYRWNYGSAGVVEGSLTIEGMQAGYSPWDMTFAHGSLYVTSRHPTGFVDRPNRIYQIDPATRIGVTWLGELATYFNPKGIAFDAAANRFLVSHYQDAPTPGSLPPGIYAIDFNTKAVTYFAALPVGAAAIPLEVASGHLWSVITGNVANGMSLSTLVWGAKTLPLASPASGPLAWAPGVVSGCDGVVYCTSGTSTQGCVPTICASGVPSGSSASGFNISVAGLDGQRAGLILYGISGPLAAPWSATSTSFRCVKTPNQRMGAQNSGGTAGACDGVLTEDWNAYLATHPSALGQPYAGGETVWASAWYRDPPASKSSSLSNGLEFYVQP
jgi:hypothetical protein